MWMRYTVTAVTTLSPITTAEQLLAAGDIGRCDLVRGELVMMSPANPEHSRIMARLTHALLSHLDKHSGQAEVYPGDPGFLISTSPDTVRAPDIAVVKSGRALPARGFFHGAPELAIEIISPGGAAGEVLAKTQEWLSAGTREVWLVDPLRRTVTVRVADRAPCTLKSNQVLSCEWLLPGFGFAVANIFR